MKLWISSLIASALVSVLSSAAATADPVASAPTSAPVRSDADRARYGPVQDQHPCGLWGARFAEMQRALVTASSNDRDVQQRWGVYGESLARVFNANLDHVADDNRAWAPPNQLQAARTLANAYRQRFDLLSKHQPASVPVYYGVQIARLNWDAVCLAVPSNPHLLLAPDGTTVTPH